MPYTVTQYVNVALMYRRPIDENCSITFGVFVEISRTDNFEGDAEDTLNCEEVSLQQHWRTAKREGRRNLQD